MDLCASSASELSLEVRERRISPVEIVRAHLKRIAARNELLRAYVFVDEDGALDSARAAEAEITTSGQRTPLHGLPVAFKDVFDVAGMPTTAASRLLLRNLARSDSTVAARLRQAGTVVLGKLNTFEFAAGGQEVFGEARNPWNLAYATGGSSTGAGAALGARLTPLAIGSDTGGSVRIPASFCGVVALRPTRGRVGRAGTVTLSQTLDEVGPMTRTVRDCALLLQAMAGAAPGDPSALEVSVPDYGAALERNLTGVRLGVPSPLWGDCDPEVAQAFVVAVQTLERLGAHVEKVSLQSAEYGLVASWAISYSEAFASHREAMEKRGRDYTPAFFNKISGAACLTAEELEIAAKLCKTIAAEFAEVLHDLDAIVLPTTPFPAYPLGHQHLQGDNGVYTRPISCAGLPALAVPCGFTRRGMPVGLQIVGRPWGEAALLAIGNAYQCATPWHEMQPAQAAVQGVVGTARRPASVPSPIDEHWVRRYAELNGFHFIEDADCAAIAASIGPVKAILEGIRSKCLQTKPA